MSKHDLIVDLAQLQGHGAGGAGGAGHSLRKTFSPTPEHLVVFRQVRECLRGQMEGSRGRRIKIDALAGSGKTTTLLEILVQILCPAIFGQMAGDSGNMHFQHPPRVFVGAFGKAIAEELRQRMAAYGYDESLSGGQLRISTLHSAGLDWLNRWLRCMRPDFDRLTVEKQAINDWVRERFSRERTLQQKAAKLGGLPLIGEAIEIAVLTGIGVKSITDMREELQPELDWNHPMDPKKMVIPLVAALKHYSVIPPGYRNADELALVASNQLLGFLTEWEMAVRTGERIQPITQNLMTYLPLILQFPPEHENSMPRYDWVLVDEDQDLSATRQALACKLLYSTSSNMISVGDRNQAIMGFSGAEANADASMQVLFNHRVNASMEENQGEPRRCGLTISWRLSKAQARHAQLSVPKIQAAPDAPEGEEHGELLTNEFWEKDDWVSGTGENVLGPGDVILCRMNAPLVRVALRLVIRGVRCRVLGTDVGMRLINLIIKAARHQARAASISLDENWKPLLALVLEDLKDQMGVLGMKVHANDMGGDLQLALQMDELGAAVSLLEVLQYGEAPEQAGLVEVVSSMVRALFVAEDREFATCLELSTIHKSKGKEWPGRVIIWQAKKLIPLRWARQAWELAQEENLLYVARTRCTKTGRLWYVDDEKGKEKEE